MTFYGMPYNYKHTKTTHYMLIIVYYLIKDSRAVFLVWLFKIKCDWQSF